MLQLRKPGNEIVNGELQAIANPPLHDIADKPAGQTQVEGNRCIPNTECMWPK